MRVKSGLESDYEFWKTLNETDELLGRDITRMVEQLGELLDQQLNFEEVDKRVTSRHGPNFAAYWKCVSKEISRFHPRGFEFVVWKQSKDKRSRSAA